MDWIGLERILNRVHIGVHRFLRDLLDNHLHGIKQMEV
uniref:Uncharacterized protein n=1 Tax=Magnetococcus massalia (strain MO-1) TaxID=451514 RepID=A0A1S7LL77_MAGMO|nr:protein of unknown function [Candidatus Magnetococcus massalia]